MGYPDTFRIPVSDTRAYKQFGNSVVMPVFREVARVMKPWIMQQTYKPLMTDMWINDGINQVALTAHGITWSNPFLCEKVSA
ncbi:MAG: DNA cytosine methyltransferase [Candidatus Thiothrix putei]|uniref:DNA cytosine methyltransferase n=1 Tax=Candidatus Thiothrix putei TaxID=3080811 RepID=A0AA95KI87_9GAMM|nr:MAG: DNA cytosine methyltransferase [Candidatus Thiothrix putei]